MLTGVLSEPQKVLPENEYFKLIGAVNKLEIFYSFFDDIIPKFYREIVNIEKRKALRREMPLLLLLVIGHSFLDTSGYELAKYCRIVECYVGHI